MSASNQNTILANIPIKKSSKDTIKSNKNIMINFENQLQQKVEDMFKVDGLKILVKRGKTFGLLTIRYYKIVRDFLYYYKSKTITIKPKGILNLRDSSLKVELEYGKIIKEKQFGIKVQGVKTHGVFWLVSQNQAENIILFKYLKLLNGSFQIKQLPILSNRNLRGGANSSLINNSICSQGDGGLENMMSEERINQIGFMDAQLNLALRNIDSSVVFKIDKPQLEDQNGLFDNPNKQIISAAAGEFRIHDNQNLLQQNNSNQIAFNNQINSHKDRNNYFQDGDYSVEKKENNQQFNVNSKKINQISFQKKQETENEQIFEEEEGFKNKQWGQVQYHNSSTYFGESQKQSTKNSHSLNYSSQQKLGQQDQVIHLNLQISPKRKQPHTASSLNEKNSSGNKSHLYQINYSPNFNNIYGKGYDDEFLQREIGDVQLPSSPKKVIQFDEDFDEEYIDYYGEINLNYTSGLGSAITSQNTLNQIKKPHTEQQIPSSQNLMQNQNSLSQQNFSQNQILLIDASSHLTQMLSPTYTQKDSNFLKKYNNNEDYAQQLNMIKEQGKKIEESIKTSELMLNYYKEQYEQIKKSFSCLDEAEEQNNEKNKNKLNSKAMSLNPQSSQQSQQLNMKNSNNYKSSNHNQSKSETNLIQYIHVDQNYEDINYNDFNCQIPIQNLYQSQNSIEFKLQLNDKLKNKSAPHSPNNSMVKANKFINKSDYDENIAEDSQEGSNDQQNSRYVCRNMDILSNNNPHQRTQTDLAQEAEENSEEEDDYYLSEKPKECNSRSSNCNEIKESKYQSGISNKTTSYQQSEYKIVLNEEQKKLNKEMKEICNQENSLRQIDDLDFKILDEIKDEVGRNASQLSKPSPFLNQSNSNIRRSKSAVQQKKNITNQIKYKERASEKNICQSNVYDEEEGEEEEEEYSENIDNSEHSQTVSQYQGIQKKFPYEEQDEIIQSSKINEKGSIQIDSSGNVVKQLEQSISQGSSNSPQQSYQSKISPIQTTKRNENDLKEFKLNNSYKKNQIIDISDDDLNRHKESSPNRVTNLIQNDEFSVKKSQKIKQIDAFEFQEPKISEERLNSNSIYVCLEEICSMIWKNFIREAQEQIHKLKQRFTKKQFLIDIAELEVELLIISFSGQVENLNVVSEKVDQILKSIKFEQKQKQNFYDLCLCEINQAELFLIKESKLLDSLKTNTLNSQLSPGQNSHFKGNYDFANNSQKIQQILNKFYFGKGFFATAFSFLPDGILSFLKLLGYSNDTNVGIKWLEKCLQDRSLRSNYAAILLSLIYVERKSDNQKGLEIIKQAQRETKLQDSICLSWVQSLILMNLEEAEQAEKCLLKGILHITENIKKNNLQQINLNIIMYELCWLEIIQMKWSLSLSHLEELICRSLDIQIFKSIYKVAKKHDCQHIKIIEEKVKQLQKQQSKVQLPLKIQMILHLACCFIEVGQQQFARAYLQISLIEYNLMTNSKKQNEDLIKLIEKYLNRPNLLYVQYEVHYLLKLTSKLSDPTLLKNMPYIRQQMKQLDILENSPSTIPQKISICTFLSVINCFIGKYFENEELYEIFQKIQESKLKQYDYILQHFYFWCAMSFFHRKMFSESLQAFEKAKKIKNTEFSILEKVEKNITQLQTYIEKEKSRRKSSESGFL